MNTTEQHDDHILDQFTRQAIPFAERHAASDGELLQLLVEASGVGLQDHVLDIACGPGLVSCAFAPVARHVTGLDFVPAMLEKAEILRKKKGLSNVSWQQGRATSLPFNEGEFNAVITRFSFHHYLEPAAALREMRRVCKPAGMIMVADVAPAAASRDAYDMMEKWRDPSHTQALTEEELEKLGQAAGLKLERKVRYQLESDLEGLLQASFPRPGDADKIRAAVRRDILSGKDELGIGAHERHGIVYFFFPVLALVWRNADD